MVIKLVTKTDEAQNDRNDAARQAIITIQKRIDAGDIEGFAMVILCKDGTNWTDISPIADNLKMIGSIEWLKLQVARLYEKAPTYNDKP